MSNRKKHRGASLIEAVEPRILFRTVFVDPNSPAALRDGAGWSSAYNSYSEAMIYAAAGDELRLADAVYKPTATTNRAVSFTIRNGLTIKGGYAGYGAPDPDARDTNLYQTIFSGDIGVEGDISDNSTHVFQGTTGPAGTRTTYDGIVITGGNANATIATSSDAQGGGAYGTSANFVNCLFTQNYAMLGGAVYSPQTGGLSNCTFTNNSAVDGAAVYVTAADTIINLCTFAGNSAARDGGAVYTGASLSMQSCSFTSNSAANRGGAIANVGNSSITLAICTFTRNSAVTGGAIDLAAGGAAFINRGVFNGNLASGLGGAIRVQSATFKLMNSTFTSNSGSAGGAVSTNCQQSPLILNCTFTGNVATQITRHVQYSGAVPSIVNSIIWDPNSLPKSTYADYDTLSSYSNVPGGSAGSHNVDLDPLFMRNPAPGQDGVWATADDDYGNLRLYAFSPLVDAADTFAMSQNGIGDRDVAGRLRFFDVPTTPDTGIGGQPMGDIGAHEAVPTRIVVTTGPYAGVKRQNLTLQALAASTVAGALQYAWDFDADGQFDDATGASPVFIVPVLPDNTLLSVSVRVTDGAAVSYTSSTTVRVGPDYLRVDSRATGANDGSSWGNAFVSLKDALNYAVSGQEIHVAGGIYKPTTSTDRNVSFALRNGIAIRGGYAGVGSPNPDLRDLAAYPSVLSGNIGAAGSNVDNSRHVVVAQGLDSSAVLDGFTIADGYNFGGSGPLFGGGGMSIDGGAPTIQSCTFTANLASMGGAVEERSASSTFIDCVFIANGGDRGAGVYESNCTSLFQNCSFIENNVFIAGPGIWAEGSTTRMDRCIFTGNLSAGAYFYGCPSVKVTNSVFTGNRGASALIATNGLSIEVTGCIFSGNVSNSGAAVRLSAPNVLVANCTFADNNKLTPSLQLSYSTATVANCIFWSAQPSSVPHLDATALVNLQVKSTDIQGGYAGAGNINSNPLFVRNPSPGADGQWDGVNDDYGDLRLQAGSPCIDSGDNSLVPAGTVIDVAGNARFVDSPGVNDAGAIVDMGALERQLPVYAKSALFQTDGVSPSLNVSFNVPLTSSSISESDLVIQTILGDGTLGGNIPVTEFSYNPATRSVRFFMPANIADGNYRATIAAGSVIDSDGNAGASASSFDFFTLAGDANHDRRVDINDLAALSMFWLQPGREFSQGDFDYSGTVDSKDLALLSANWQRVLAEPVAAVPLAAKTSPPKRTATRVAAMVL